MNPTELLKEEHKIIQDAIGAVEREAESARATGKIRADRIEKMIEFFQGFVTRCHHAKEEKHLFLLLLKHGWSGDTGLIGQLLSEHRTSRQTLESIGVDLIDARQGEAAAIEAVRWSMVNYARMLRLHIDREEGILFPQVNGTLTPDEQLALVQAFEKVEAEEMGTGVHEKFHRLAKELAETAG